MMDKGQFLVCYTLLFPCPLELVLTSFTLSRRCHRGHSVEEIEGRGNCRMQGDSISHSGCLISKSHPPALLSPLYLSLRPSNGVGRL